MADENPEHGLGSGADKVGNLHVSKHAGLPPPALESQ